MAHWNHRVVRETLNTGDFWYSVREVFYNDDGTIYAYTKNPVDVSGESVDDLKQYAEWILACFDKEILIDEEVEFVDYDEKEAKAKGFDTVEEFLMSLDKEDENACD